eukprot:scaffold82490_cov24-Tisochrysis_lutea.AAC.1
MNAHTKLMGARACQPGTFVYNTGNFMGVAFFGALFLLGIDSAFALIEGSCRADLLNVLQPLKNGLCRPGHCCECHCQLPRKGAKVLPRTAHTLLRMSPGCWSVTLACTLRFMPAGVVTAIKDMPRFEKHSRPAICSTVGGFGLLLSTMYASSLGTYLLDAVDHYVSLVFCSACNLVLKGFTVSPVANEKYHGLASKLWPCDAGVCCKVVESDHGTLLWLRHFLSLTKLSSFRCLSN